MDFDQFLTSQDCSQSACFKGFLAKKNFARCFRQCVFFSIRPGEKKIHIDGNEKLLGNIAF